MTLRRVQLRNKRKRRSEESDEEFVLEEEGDAKRSNVKRPIDQGVGSVSKRRGRGSLVCLETEKRGYVWAKGNSHHRIVSSNAVRHSLESAS